MLEYCEVDGEGVSQIIHKGKSGSRGSIWSIWPAYEGGTVFVAIHPIPQNDDIVQRGGFLSEHIHGP